ncbi:ESX secretion-associated protein EspG [Allokutzneria oryzae]|uniref:ESX secretion-associated protein EspG n=1 Tax=Allokutzneria oryzae TaxID=1378989 RepID=A0ABV5ZWI8_9PSEU
MTSTSQTYTVRTSLPAIPAPVYEVCWARLGLGVMPFPLVVLRTSDDPDDHSAVQARAAHWLREHDLGDEHRIGPELTEALRTIADFDMELAVVYTEHEVQTRIGSFARGGRALRAVLRADTVELRWIETELLAASALAVVPEYGPGTASPVRVAADDLARAGRHWERSGVIRETGRVDAERFLGIYATATAVGQASALRPSTPRSCKLVAQSPVTWLDTPEGRYAVTHSDGWMSLAAASSGTVSRHLSGLLSGRFS